MTEPHYIEVEYALEVVCDHAGRATAPLTDRVVSRVYYVPNTRGAIGFLRWREASLEHDLNYPPALQTYFGTLRELLDGSAQEEQSAVLRDPSERAGLLTSRASGSVMEGTRWRFWCADCGDTLPVRGSIIEPVFDQLRQHRVPRVTLAELRRVALP